MSNHFEVPLRLDGMPDLNNKEIIMKLSDKKLGELDEIRKTATEAELFFIRRAIETREANIASFIITELEKENISIKDAISVLDKTKDQINEYKLSRLYTL